ncbi:protein kinase domain-containing protein [Streptomyces sp. CA-111067]|uniref:serine/threonine-protein kinase n=1 Tax=Streptomyces sp. CA-111067 TaxID=3240046 RepID=UPI003D98541D
MASDGGWITASQIPRDVVAGRYRITGRLGRGGMGTVWRATDELLDRQVAVKEMHLPEYGLSEHESSTQRDRALREARSVARIQHPHVVVVYDVVQQDGRPWIVMELVDGRSLAAVLSEDGPLPPREAARIGAAVAGALRAAHDREIQHRDVKPANVLIEQRTGRVVLTDFGIARIPGSATISETGAFVGSPEYTAPERMMPGGGSAGPESDLWSLGALLCAAVDGHSPFHRESIGEIVHAVAIDDIRPPSAVGALLPVVHGLLDRDPARRMAAAEAMTVLTAYAEYGIEPPTPQLVRRPEPDLGADPGADPGAAADVGGPAGRTPADRAGTPQLPTGGGPGPLATRRGRGRRRAGIAVLTVLAVAAGATAAVLVTRGSGGDPAAATTGAPVVRSTAPATTAGPAKPPASSAPHTAPVPAGSTRVEDPKGFSVVLPAGYVRDPEPPRTYYWSADRGFRFGEREQKPDPRGPYGVMHDQDVAGPSANGYKGYRDGVITRTTHRGQEAALWEFTYDGFPNKPGARRTFDLCWTQDGRMYDLWLSAPIARVEQARAIFDEAVASFRPHR